MTNGEQHTERALLLLIEQGDQEAFRQLFIAHQPRLYTAAIKILGDADLAEDVLQDTFLQVWLKRHMLSSIDNFAGWLFIIARNKMYDAIKRVAQQRTGRLDFLANQPADNVADTDHGLHAKELQEILHQAVTRLPERQRLAYQLVKQEGKSRDEAAKIMQVAPETLKSHMEQAMRNIRAYCLSRLDGKLLVLFIALLH